MCEFTNWSYKNEALRFFERKSAGEVVTPHISSKFPFALQQKCCPVCGKYLENWERRPSGRTTRSMCIDDYEALVANRINYNCFVCNMSLPEHKIGAQMGNQRQIIEHIHKGACMKRWTVIHNVAVGEPDFVATFRNRSDFPYVNLNPGGKYVFENEGFAEGNMFTNTHRDVGYNSSFQHLQPVSYEEQLPSVSFNLNYQINEILNDIQNPGAKLTIYKGKRVKTISKYR